MSKPRFMLATAPVDGVRRGPLRAHEVPYITKHGFPVLWEASPKPSLPPGSYLVNMQAGMTVIDYRGDMLFHVGIDGELIPLLVQVVPASTGVGEAAISSEAVELLESMVQHADPIDMDAAEIFNAVDEFIQRVRGGS